MNRIAGKRGLRPSHAWHIARARLTNFATLPSAPASADVTNGVPNWFMLGNDTYGNCGPVSTYHNFMAKACNKGKYEAGFVLPTDSLVENNYFAYGTAMGEPGPRPDQGVDLGSWLNWCWQQGIIEGYASLDITNVEEVHSAMVAFDGVVIGVNLTDDAEQLFAAGQPWTTAQGETPDPNAGHAILQVKYDSVYDYFVTWGQVQPATLAWDGSCVGEAWVILSKEDAKRLGVNWTALQAAITSWGGKLTPTPVPTPKPIPSPAPSPTPVSPAPTPSPNSPNWFVEAIRKVIVELEAILKKL